MNKLLTGGLFIAMIAISSCQKNYTCTCYVNTGGTKQQCCKIDIKAKPGDAETECKNSGEKAREQNNITSGTVTCELD